MAGASTGGGWQAPPTPAAGGLTAAAAGKGHAGASSREKDSPTTTWSRRTVPVRPHRHAPTHGAAARTQPRPASPASRHPPRNAWARFYYLSPPLPRTSPPFSPRCGCPWGGTATSTRPPASSAGRRGGRRWDPACGACRRRGGGGGAACARRRRGGGEGGAPEAPIHRRARERRGWVSPDSHRRAPWRQRRAAAPRQPHLDSRTAGRCGDAAMKAKVRKIPLAPRAPPTGESPPPHPRVPITCRRPCRRGAQSRTPAAGATAPPPAAPSCRRGGGAAPASPPAPLPASARTRRRG